MEGGDFQARRAVQFSRDFGADMRAESVEWDDVF